MGLLELLNLQFLSIRILLLLGSNLAHLRDLGGEFELFLKLMILLLHVLDLDDLSLKFLFVGVALGLKLLNLSHLQLDQFLSLLHLS